MMPHEVSGLISKCRTWWHWDQDWEGKSVGRHLLIVAKIVHKLSRPNVTHERLRYQ